MGFPSFAIVGAVSTTLGHLTRGQANRGERSRLAGGLACVGHLSTFGAERPLLR